MASTVSGCPCSHPFGAHGRGAGACRINGCPCPEFGYGSLSVEPEFPAPLVPARHATDRTRAELLFVAAAVGWIVGLLMGIRL